MSPGWRVAIAASHVVHSWCCLLCGYGQMSDDGCPPSGITRRHDPVPCVLLSTLPHPPQQSLTLSLFQSITCWNHAVCGLFSSADFAKCPFPCVFRAWRLTGGCSRFPPTDMHKHSCTCIGAQVFCGQHIPVA